MNITAIDIGTNTVLLLIASVDESGRISPLVYEQRIPRLGQGVDANKNLQPDAMERTIRVLKEYQELIGGHALEEPVVCGTSAVRDAANREEFAAGIRAQTGWALEVLNGEDEALWTYRGAISGLPEVGGATVVDVGGGSTEIIVGDRGVITEKISLQVGSVRLTERIFRHDPPTHPELEAAIEVVENEIARAGRFPLANTRLIGVAGTATSLALIAQGSQSFDIHAVTNYRMSTDLVNDLFRRLRGMPSEMILHLSPIMRGRADVITAGSLILREIMEHFRFDEITVSERGVRYGLVLREWEKRRMEGKHS
jgi:exopolyphosphatase / guanosine-5'-triphosphate,3'-diphosphate pyrophosphatase